MNWMTPDTQKVSLKKVVIETKPEESHLFSIDKYLWQSHWFMHCIKTMFLLLKKSDIPRLKILRYPFLLLMSYSELKDYYRSEQSRGVISPSTSGFILGSGKPFHTVPDVLLIHFFCAVANFAAKEARLEHCARTQACQPSYLGKVGNTSWSFSTVSHNIAQHGSHMAVTCLFRQRMAIP